MKRDLVYILAIIVLTLTLMFSVSQCSSRNTRIDNLKANVTALTDTIQYYTGKNGELVAEKTLLIGDNKLLRQTNSDLYNQLKSMKVKNEDLALQLENKLVIEKHDTVYVEIKTGHSGTLEIKDQYFILQESISSSGDILYITNVKLDVPFKYTIAVKDNTAYLTSDNPYVHFDSVSGIVMAKQKPKRWNIGIQVGVGMQYGLVSKSIDAGPYIGVGLSYGFGF